MNVTQRTMAGLGRLLARKLRKRLEAPERVFRDNTVNGLHGAIAEAVPQLAGTGAEPAVKALAYAVYRLTPTDLRRSKLLRRQVAEACRRAEHDVEAALAP